MYGCRNMRMDMRWDRIKDEAAELSVWVVSVSVWGGHSWRSRWCRLSIVSCVFIRSPVGPSTSGSGSCGLLPLGDVSVSDPSVPNAFVGRE